MESVSDDEFFDAPQSHRRHASSSASTTAGLVHIPHLLLQPMHGAHQTTPRIIPSGKETDHNVGTTASEGPLQQSRLKRAYRHQLVRRLMRQNAAPASKTQSNSEKSCNHRDSIELSIESGASTAASEAGFQSENRLVVTRLCDLERDRDREQENDRSQQSNDLKISSKQRDTPVSKITTSPPRARDARAERPSSRYLHTHDFTLSALTGAMDRVHSDDLFMQEADGDDNGDGNERIERLLSGRAQQNNRRSLPPTEPRPFTSMEGRRPWTSGGPRPSSRLGLVQSQRDQDVADAGRAASFAMEGVTMRPRRPGSRYSATSKLQPLSPKSPGKDLVRSPDMLYGRLRPFSAAPQQQQQTSHQVHKSLESEGDSPADSSEPKQSLPESTSPASQTAPSTVWDELDDLKSRIKKLELTGKLPPTSGSAIDSSPQMERPRTATTAPTTIDSSPKREKKTEDAEHEGETQSALNVQQSHPLLHAALTKAKPLLNPTLYRSLQATTAEALQLSDLAGRLGAASGGTADRQMRRKADTMCRNLTDLCLALCEGKHESTPPLADDIPAATPPTGRFSRAASRHDSDPRSYARPLSRLEARRSSILGVGSGSSPILGSSPGRDAEDLSASEVDAASQYLSVGRQRFARSSSRLSSARLSRYDDISADEDPTIRPPSRNGSEFSFRSKQVSYPREHNEPARRSFSLREPFSNRRSSGGPGNRELSRIASMTSDSGRRWTRESTPPVLEEEISEQEQHNPTPPSQPRQRMTSLGHFRQRGLKESALRSSSISRRTSQGMIE